LAAGHIIAAATSSIPDKDKVIVCAAAGDKDRTAVSAPRKAEDPSRFEISDLNRLATLYRLLPKVLNPTSVGQYSKAAAVRRPCELCYQFERELFFYLADLATLQRRYYQPLFEI
jgi:hypothetical protein